MVAAKTPKNPGRLDAARAILKTAGCDARTAIRSGNVELALQAYQTEHDIDLLVMGAFGHSRVHRLWLGSTHLKNDPDDYAPSPVSTEKPPQHVTPPKIGHASLDVPIQIGQNGFAP